MGSVGGEELMQGPSSSGCEEKIVVSVRLRPLNEKEIARNDVSDWECVNDNTIVFRNNLTFPERSMYPMAYTFDRVFRCDCSTRKVYEEGAKEIALSAVSGINSSIFAYGQTSSGKTFTMSGITEYTIADIYDYVKRHKERDFLLKFSAMEIYNESVRDLLSSDSTPLRLLDDPERGTTVEKLTETILRDWNHLKELLSFCEAQRQNGETAMNETSSRSHQIIRLTIESSIREFLSNDHFSSLTATVNFVDLAGSERASQSLSAGSRLKEGCHINRSLLTLGTVIRKLSKGRNGHIPFRDSKLTRILQSSLAGNARTAIICTMSPARSHVEQSRNTLLFASCAKEVSTNAQVNVVMSDKALVKHLQRELAILKAELRNSGPIVASDSAALLIEKDLQIEELKKEIAKLILERDVAQSQVEDLIRPVEHDGSLMSTARVDHHYPKLRVRSSWGDDNPTSDISDLVDSHSPDVESSNISQNSDPQSRINSDKHYKVFPDFSEGFQQKQTSPRGSICNDFDGDDLCKEWGKVDGSSDEDAEDICKEVRCVEVDQSSMNRHMDFNSKFPEENTEVSEIMKIYNKDTTKQEPVSFSRKEDKEFICIQPVHSFASPEEAYPCIPPKIVSSSRSLTLTKSRSCEKSLVTNFSSIWFENMENNEGTSNVLVKDLTARLKELQSKISALKNGTDNGRLSGKGSQTSLETGAVEDPEAHNGKISSDKNLAGMDETVAGMESMADLQCDKDLADILAPEAAQEADKPAKNVKDAGLDPVQDDRESPLNWASKFKSIQREIMELWHACHISLVHRTYFFLLFKGDPSDAIYMEVEIRKLSFLKDKFSQGNQTLKDGLTLSLPSSMKGLLRERKMLSKRMLKLSDQERQSLYLKWGIGLNTKNRRLQLAQRLWTDTKDMDNIIESANIVAKLVGFIEPGKAFKEMFWLNFTPQSTSRRSYRWKRIMISLL